MFSFLCQVLQTIVRRLYVKKVLWTDDAEKLSKFMVLKMRDNWRAKNTLFNKVFIVFLNDFSVSF